VGGRRLLAAQDQPIAYDSFEGALNQQDDDTLLRELRPAIQPLADALFGVSEVLLRKHGNFMPSGAALRADGRVARVVFGPGVDHATSAEVLPGLQSALRDDACEGDIRAIGLAEYVTVAREGCRPTDAIKVLIEHRRGLSVALYMPFKKGFIKGYTFGELFCRHVDPEVGAFA
jgi:hypothetical protein